MGLLMVIAMALMLGYGGGQFHMMGHDSPSKGLEIEVLKSKQVETTSANEKKASAIPQGHSDPESKP